MRPPCIFLLGDGEAEARAVLGLGVRAVDLMELLEDPISLIKGYARPGVRHRDGELAVAAPAAMLTSPASVNLMALPTRLSSTCLRRCSSPRPTGSDTLWYSALALTQGNLDVDREEEIAIITAPMPCRFWLG